MAQHDYTSQFNNVQANAKLVIHSHDGTEYEYLPFGTDVEVPAVFQQVKTGFQRTGRRPRYLTTRL